MAKPQPDHPEPVIPTGAHQKQPATLSTTQVTGFVQGQSRELVDQRTPRSTMFANPDGTRTQRFYTTTAFLPDERGRMAAVDTTVVSEGGRFRGKLASDSSFSVVSTDSQLATLSVAGGTVGYSVEGAAAVNGTASGSDVVYADIRAHSDLRLSPTAEGFKESIVLRSPQAPTLWRFPLRLNGLTPSLTAGGSVQLRDAQDAVQLVIPPGYMTDSVPDPRTGEGSRSNGVAYALAGDQATGWTLEVRLDEGWLRDPARRFPVVVDPSFRIFGDLDDTFVSSRDFAGRDNSAETFLKIGTYNGGGERSAAYVRFSGAELPATQGSYVVGAALNVHQTWARSCTPSTVSVYPVFGSWYSQSSLTWPGGYDSTKVGSKAFAHGGNCGDPDWESIPINVDWLTRMFHGAYGTDWSGFTLRASNTDNNGEKYFTAANLHAVSGPTLDLILSGEGASYSLPQDYFDPAVTPVGAGRLPVRVTNLGAIWWGSTTGHKLVAAVLNSSNQEVQRKVLGLPPGVVDPMDSVTFPVEIGPLAGGSYRLKLNMADPSGRLFDAEYGVPAGIVPFVVDPNLPPTVKTFHPRNDAEVGSLQPTLWADYYDVDNGPSAASYFFEICQGDPDFPEDCFDSGWTSSSSWQVPAGALTWSKQAFWSVNVSDGSASSGAVGPIFLMTVVSQPDITHHLAGAADNSEIPGINPQVGNYSTTAVDASVTVPGPALAVSRTYNSQDPRSSGGFGAGWSTPFDQRLVVDGDGSGNVVVTLASGRQIRFGKNPDGGFAPPAGMAMTLVRGTGKWTLVDASGERREFNDAGLLTSVADSYGRKQSYAYADGKLTRVTDLTSQRYLDLTWTGNRITTVKTNRPSAGDPEPTWTYAYTGDTLTSVCSPLSALACTRYEYQSSSHYRSLVTDANPAGYWPVGETSGTAAKNVVARRPEENAATHTTAVQPTDGALAGTADKAATFTGTNSLVLPNNLVTSEKAFAVEAWFKAASGNRGIIFAEQNAGLPNVPTTFTPALYIGTDGKLYGRFWTSGGGTSMASTQRVDNGLWHHAVISVNVTAQELYLDGARIGTLTTTPVDHLENANTLVGNGYANTSWPAAVNGYFPLTGALDEVAVYKHPLSAAQVLAHYAARTATWRLTRVIEPGEVTTLAVGYDGASGRVATARDPNGADWTIGQPVVGDGTWEVTVAAPKHEQVTYTFDADHGGKLMSRRTANETEKWFYNEFGFVQFYQDHDGRTRQMERDLRGNIIGESAGGLEDTQGWRFYDYFYNEADPLDPRNNQLVWSSGVRTGWDRHNDVRTLYTLDTSGRVTQISYPKPAGAATRPVEKFTFTTGTEAAVSGGLTPPGLLATATNRLGGVTSYHYTSRGNLARVLDPAGLTTEFAYDELGRSVGRTTSTIVNRQLITYGTWRVEYDAVGLVRRETAPAVYNQLTSTYHSAVTSYTYDDAGRLKTREISDGLGGDPARLWRYDYTAGKLTSETAPDGGVTTRVWNTAGDVESETRPNGLTLVYRYNDARQVIETTAVGAGVDPMNPSATSMIVESRAYDPAGQLTNLVDAMGRETVYSYRIDGTVSKVERVRRNQSGDVVSRTTLAQYSYDYGVKPVRVTGPNGIVRDLDFDDVGYLSRETLDPTGLARTTTYTRNAEGEALSVRRSNGFTVVAGSVQESTYLHSHTNDGLNPGGHRTASGSSSSFTYRFAMPADTVTASLEVEVYNTYLVQASSDNINWTTLTQETNQDIYDGSNRTRKTLNLTPFLGTSKTVYVRFGTSSATSFRGGSLARAAVDFVRAGEQPARAAQTFDLAGRPTKVSVDNPGGTPATLNTIMNRDARGLVKQMVDPTGAATDYTYDEIGDLATITKPSRTVVRDGVISHLNPLTTLGHNTFGDITEQRDHYGAVTATQYDQMGRPKQIRLPVYTPPAPAIAIQPVFSATYDFDGNPLLVTDSLGGQTSHTYDKYGRLTRRQLPDPDGAGPKRRPVNQYAYDRVGEPLTVFASDGGEIRATYNDLGHQITETTFEIIGGQPVFFTTNLDNDDAGNLTRITTPLGRIATFAYNAAGEMTLATDPGGVTVEQRYDAVGQLRAEILAGIRGSSLTYDAAGRQLTRSDHTVVNGQLSAPIRTQHMSYDAAGRPLSHASGQARVTSYTYDPDGNTTSVTQRVNPADPASAVTVGMGYDALGNHTRTIDGNGHITDFLYNSWGLQTGVREPATATLPALTWTSVYNAAGLAVSEQVPGGITRQRTYDALGRLTTETATGTATPTTGKTFDYDAAGRLIKTSSPAGDTTYTWNRRGLLETTTSPAGQSTRGYNADGQLITRTDPAGSATYTYHATTGRLTTAHDPLTTVTTDYTYNLAGDIAKASYREMHGMPTGGANREFTYDQLGRLATDTTAWKGSTPLPPLAAQYKTTYTYDNDDLITHRLTEGAAGTGAHQYQYDGLSRLKTWTKPDTQTVGYGYDNASNRTSVTTAAGTRTFTYDERNRLVSATGAGQPNLTNVWSPRGTLETTTLGTDTSSYKHDAFDRLVEIQTPGHTGAYTYDAADRVATYNGSNFGYGDQTNKPTSVPMAGSPTPISYGAAGDAFGFKTGSADNVLIADRLHGDAVAAGSPDSGGLSATAAYDPYGQKTSSAGSLPLGFQGGWTDPDSGLVNAHTRWYSPQSATFTSRDSWTLTPDPVAQANRYSYANASPITFNDTSGHCIWDACLIEGGLTVAGALWLIGALTATGIGIAACVDYCPEIHTGGSASTPNLDDPDFQKVRAVVGLGVHGVSSAVSDMVLKGVSAQEILSFLRSYYSNIDSITRIVGTTTATATTTGTTAIPRAQTTVAAIPTVKPLPPIQQTITNTRPPTTTLTPAGAGLYNGVHPAVSATSSSIVLANTADGAEATNQAGAQIAAGAAATELADTGKPPGCDNDDQAREWMLAIFEDAIAEVLSGGLAGVDALLTEPQRRALARQTDPGRRRFLEAVFRGQRIHIAVRDLVQLWYGGQWGYRSGGKNNEGPDFPHKMSKYEVELTTPGEVPGHHKRGGGYDNCFFALYDMPSK